LGSGRRGRLITERDKQETIVLIEEAHEAGCRIKPACELLELDIRTLQRWQCADNLNDKRHGPITQPANKLTAAQRARILEVANSAPYCNQSPSQIVPNLADEQIYIASESSFYRTLKQANMLKHRSASKPKAHKKPAEFSAIKPNQLWTWDITYLMSLIRGQYFYLYLFVDVFSRKIVGFDVFDTESAEHAAEVVTDAYINEKLREGDVALHSDNGGPMKGATMLATLKNLGVMPSFSRPSVSNDNPYSESLFKTLKYCPEYPSNPFACVADAKGWVKKFVDWYNNIHLHSGIKFVTPNSRHQGLDKQILEKRIVVYQRAKQENPNRWSKKTRNWEHVDIVYLNKKSNSKKMAA